MKPGFIRRVHRNASASEAAMFKKENHQEQTFFGTQDTFSFSSNLSQRVASNCDGCEGEECIRASGTLVSSFQANPTVTLPSVPSGLSECEEAAVSRFINTTLRRHELQHVAAFNTYNATIRTRINYTGCRDALDAHLQNIHDGIEQRRRASSDARSAALDPFNANIPCDCD